MVPPVKKRLGIQQPDVQGVTGTVVMLDDPDEMQSRNDSMKRSETGVILQPQPHDSPNDPLNWSMWRRDICLLVIGFQSFLGGGQSPLLAAGLSSLATEFDKPITTISYLVGGFMLSLGCGSVIASPSAVLYGKRLVYLAGILLFLAGSLWGGAAPDFGNLMGARVLCGFGASPTESLPSATIAEIYFAHERAYRVGIYTMLMLGGKNIVPLLSGLVFQYLDRHWLFWIQSMFLGGTLLATFLFVPDTFWDREPNPNKRSEEETDAARHTKYYHPPTERPNAFALRRPTTNNVLEGVESLASSVQDQALTGTNVNPVGILEDSTAPATPKRAKSRFGLWGSKPDVDRTDPEKQRPEEPKQSWVSTMKIFTGRQTTDSWWMVALRPFFLYTYPHVLFGSFTYCFAVVWLIVISETISEIFVGEYGYTMLKTSLFYISPFVGGCLGSMSCGLISDRLVRYMVSRNHGVYEPEFRLLMVIPATIFSCIGLMGFGWSSYVHDPWIGPIILFGCLGFGSSMASTTAITFTVDSYKMFAAEALVSLNFLKNLMGFVFSLFNNRFHQSKGGRTSFVVYGCIQIALSLTAIPLYIYGKRIRAWTDSKEILRSLYRPDNLPPNPSKSNVNTPKESRRSSMVVDADSSSDSTPPTKDSF
ncbi:hypothetical protein DICA1_F40954 [Diutina catenulata]